MLPFHTHFEACIRYFNINVTWEVSHTNRALILLPVHLFWYDTISFATNLPKSGSVRYLEYGSNVRVLLPIKKDFYDSRTRY
jgi:hypothetical protein